MVTVLFLAKKGNWSLCGGIIQNDKLITCGGAERVYSRRI